MSFFGLFAFVGLIQFLIWLATFAMKAWALVDAGTRRADAFPAVDRLTKPIWLVILGISAFTGFFLGPLNFFSIIGDVASALYLVDVRPKIKAVTGR